MRRPCLPSSSRGIACAFLIAATLSGCSVRQFAANRVANALSGGGETYARDDDLELIGAALPFSLKLMETVLSETPEHEELLLSACEGFTSYAYGWVDAEADRVMVEDLRRGKEMKARARRLYLRARGYGSQAFELAHPGVLERIESQVPGVPGVPGAYGAAGAEDGLARLGAEDVPLLYWNAASLGLAISASRDDARMIAKRPVVGVLLERALELDESWGDGALHELMIVYATSDPTFVGDARGRLRGDFDRALELSGGQRAALFVSWAESLSVQAQDVEEFRELLARALAIDADANEPNRVANLLSQRRARWLLERIDELFVNIEETGSPGGPT